MNEFRTGYGTVWLDFLATHVGRYREVREEQLADAGALRRWLVEHELGPAAAPSEADAQQARELREALHAAAVATLRATAVAPAAVRTIQAALTTDRPLRLQRTEAALRLERPASAREALARLARSAVHDLTGAQRSLLRACGDDTCSGIFSDHTGRRRWCSDERCGNRARVRAHRARTRVDPESQ